VQIDRRGRRSNLKETRFKGLDRDDNAVNPAFNATTSNNFSADSTMEAKAD
jgi:hypothetical protein